MNQANQYSTHDTSTRRVLAQLAPAERCGLDGRTPDIPFHLPCGHVYCKVCAQDIAVTAQLVGQVPVCKVCYQPFQVGLPTLEEVRGRNGKGTMGGFLFPDEDEVVGGVEIIGAQARQTIINCGASTLPWVPPSQRVLQLLEEYTNPAKRSAIPATSVVSEQETMAQSALWQQGMSGQGDRLGGDYASSGSNALGDMSFDEFFDFENAGLDNDFLPFGGIGEDPIDAQDPFQFDPPLFGLRATDAPTSSQPAQQQLSESMPTAQIAISPPPHEINVQAASSMPTYPEFKYSTPNNPTPPPAPRSSLLPVPVLQPTTPSQSPPVHQDHTAFTTQRDISILAGERFCFKGHLPNKAAMEQAVRANGGLITNGGFKHTTYGVVGPGWKITASWRANGIKVIDEAGFWEVLDERRRVREAEKI